MNKESSCFTKQLLSVIGLFLFTYFYWFAFIRLFSLSYFIDLLGYSTANINDFIVYPYAWNGFKFFSWVKCNDAI